MIADKITTPSHVQKDMEKNLTDPGRYVIPEIPMPVVLVSCGTGNDSSLITISWLSVLSESPPRIGISVRPQRHSFNLLKAHKEMTVNVPTSNLIEETDFCGTYSARRVNKWCSTGLTKAAGLKVNAPVIKECPVNIECCRVGESLPMGSHHLFVYDVVAVRISDKMPVSVDERERILFFRGEYWKMGIRLKQLYFSAKILPEALETNDPLCNSPGVP